MVNKMKQLKLFGLTALTAASLASCDMMHDDTDYCPTGLYLTFKYDYNLQRANMFSDHVGAVSLYVFDEQGRYVARYDEANTAGSKPLKSPSYTMRIADLQPGKYTFIALAGQTAYDAQMLSQRAKFVRTEPAAGGDTTALAINLDKTATGSDHLYTIDNHNLPLDTLWHGMRTTPIYITNTRPTYDTLSLVRDTKHISVSLRELDNPSEMDIADYRMRIVDRNSAIRHDNSIDESDTVTYTPYATWNTTDKAPLDGETRADGDGDDTPTVVEGRTARADFMTSRLIWHADRQDDAQLIIDFLPTGREVARINLVDYLMQVRTHLDRIYGAQEYLDRGYDYGLQFFLKSGKIQYCYITVSINQLSWNVRRQFEELGK